MIIKKDNIIDDRGTALMEFVLIMPIFVFMIFCIIQLSLVCMAKQLTHYLIYMYQILLLLELMLKVIFLKR